MLCAAAKHLAQARDFNGTLNLFYQPAEEGLAGARRMLEEGVLERFPCDAVFAMHNMPGYPAGKLGFRAGAFMASADQVAVRVTGCGGHGAMPHKTVDPVVVCAAIVFALQIVVSRNVEPLDMAVITVGAIHAGEASNVIPDEAGMAISVRALRPAVRDELGRRMKEVVAAQVADPQGKRIGVVQGSTQEAYAKAEWAPHGIAVVAYQTQVQSDEDLSMAARRSVPGSCAGRVWLSQDAAWQRLCYCGRPRERSTPGGRRGSHRRAQGRYGTRIAHQRGDQQNSQERELPADRVEVFPVRYLR